MVHLQFLNHICHGNNVNQALTAAFCLFYLKKIVKNIYLYFKYLILNWTLFYNKITYKAMLDYLKFLTIYGIVTASGFFSVKINVILLYIKFIIIDYSMQKFLTA